MTFDFAIPDPAGWMVASAEAREAVAWTRFAPELSAIFSMVSC